MRHINEVGKSRGVLRTTSGYDLALATNDSNRNVIITNAAATVDNVIVKDMRK